MSGERICFNGVNGASGDYLLPPLTPHEVSTVARGEPLEADHLKELKWWYQRTQHATWGPAEGIDPKNLAQTGWGVLFAFDAGDPGQLKIRGALKALLEHRRRQAAQHKETYYREFVEADAYRPGESKQDFLARHGVGAGPANPENVPYYLLIVGSPEAIPYRFQYQLDVQYAVGRIWFDTLEEYERYAHTVVAAETGQLSRPRRMAFFGVENPDDTATSLSANELVRPLAQSMQARYPHWEVQTALKDEATKARLGALLGGNDTPALLFTASHGMGFPNGDARQSPHQGALLCQDWPGPTQWRQPIPPDFYFAADDVSDGAQCAGLLAFHFACYSAGTPRLDDFAHQAFQTPTAIAPEAFVARLPRRLLAHPQGGALAVIGHVERAWGYSFLWERAGRQIETFESTLRRLLDNHPIGSAFEFFNQRYSELSTVLNDKLEDLKFTRTVDNLAELAVAEMWTANNDARSYVIIGDPAVRLLTGDSPAVTP